MWEVMHAVNMFYCQWLMKKLLLANDLREQSQAKETERAGGVREKPCSCLLEIATSAEVLLNLAGKPQPQSDTQINRNGLIYYIKLSRKYA